MNRRPIKVVAGQPEVDATLYGGTCKVDEHGPAFTPKRTVTVSNDDQIVALVAVAEAAAVLFRPPYRHGAGLLLTEDDSREAADFERLHKALTDPDCPVEIGEELT